MGHSATIKELSEKEDSYRKYIEKIKKDLDSRSSNASEILDKTIDKYYKENQYKPINVLSGKNHDFMQKSDWSLKNIHLIINKISDSLFGSKNPPEGVKIAKADEIGKVFSQMEHMETYIAGKCFEVLGGIIESFGNSSSVSYQSSNKSAPLGAGLHLFTTVIADSYKATEFFNNNEIYQYLYLYEVKYSAEEAKTEGKIELTKLYEDQIETFKFKVESLLNDLETDKITAEQYESSTEIYNTLINASADKLNKLISYKL